MFITIYDLRFKTTAQGQRFAVTDEFDPGIKARAPLRPAFDPLRFNAQFKDIRRRIGLPP